MLCWNLSHSNVSLWCGGSDTVPSCCGDGCEPTSAHDGGDPSSCPAHLTTDPCQSMPSLSHSHAERVEQKRRGGTHEWKPSTRNLSREAIHPTTGTTWERRNPCLETYVERTPHVKKREKQEKQTVRRKGSSVNKCANEATMDPLICRSRCPHRPLSRKQNKPVAVREKNNKDTIGPRQKATKAFR